VVIHDDSSNLFSWFGRSGASIAAPAFLASHALPDFALKNMGDGNRFSLQQVGGCLEVAPLRKSMARAMHPEICSMRVAEAAKRQRCIDTEGLARGLTELRTGSTAPSSAKLASPWSNAGVPTGLKSSRRVEAQGGSG